VPPSSTRSWRSEASKYGKQREGRALPSLCGKLLTPCLSRRPQGDEALWQQPGDVTVRDLCTHFPSAAYTTLMTTLDRLYRKGFLNRVKVGRAFAYRPRYGREELASGIAANALTSLLKEQSVRPVLSFFVEEVSRRDANLLDELARLVDEKRRTQGST
jgi:predicted transcriptional regulator